MVESKVNEYVDTEFAELGWEPEDYGFKLIVPANNGRQPVWKRWKGGKVFILIRLAKTLFVLKKEVKNKQDDGTENVRRLVKFHTVIDSKNLADVYLTQGLRG